MANYTFTPVNANQKLVYKDGVNMGTYSNAQAAGFVNTTATPATASPVIAPSVAVNTKTSTTAQ
jgi:hypothetical protein